MLFASMPVILANRYLLSPEFIIAVRNDSVRLVAILLLHSCGFHSSSPRMLVGTCNLSTNKSTRNTPYIVDTILKNTTYGICYPPMKLSEEAISRQSLIQVTVSNVRDPTHSDVTHSHRGNNIDYNHQNQPSLISRRNHQQQQAGATSTDPHHLCWYPKLSPTDRMKQSTSVSRTRWNPLFDTQPPTATNEDKRSKGRPTPSRSTIYVGTKNRGTSAHIEPSESICGHLIAH